MMDTIQKAVSTYNISIANKRIIFKLMWNAKVMEINVIKRKCILKRFSMFCIVVKCQVLCSEIP